MEEAERPLVLLEWEDSAQPLPAWRFLSDPPEATVVLCRSVGWIVAETADVLMLAPNLGDYSSDDPQASGFMRIPTRCVTRRARLVEG